MTGGAQEIRAPEHLTAAHDVSAFDSGVPELDEWLRKRALANEGSGASRTYVVCAVGRVVGYYALASGGVAQAQAPGRVRRNMPDPVPVMILARLAVDRSWQGRNLGRSLLRDAILRILQAAEIGGIRAILAHAISEEAQRFYLRYGFGESPIDPMTLMMTVADARKALYGKRIEIPHRRGAAGAGGRCPGGWRRTGRAGINPGVPGGDDQQLGRYQGSPCIHRITAAMPLVSSAGLQRMGPLNAVGAPDPQSTPLPPLPTQF